MGEGVLPFGFQTDPLERDLQGTVISFLFFSLRLSIQPPRSPLTPGQMWDSITNIHTGSPIMSCGGLFSEVRSR